METITLELEQGTPDWENYLLVSNGASEASAVLGISRTGKRNELLAAKATGIAKTFSDYVRRFVLDKGHEVEALARPIAEEFIGEELFPVVMAKGNIRASCDGLTMDETIAWENKQYNAEYFELVSNGELPEEHWPQCQQVLYVTGAKKLYFTISDGTPERTVGTWVYPDAELQDMILDAWAQFEIDLKSYKHVEIVEPLKAAIIQSLPAVTVMAYGEVTTCNLPQLTPVFDKFLSETKRNGFVTDEDFSIAEGNAKEARNAAKGCVTSKEMAIKGMLSVSDVIDTLTKYEKEFNELGLALEKAVKAEKDNRKATAKLERDKAYADHIAAINDKIKPIVLVLDAADKPNFVEAMKNQRTLASLFNKLDTELARAKIAADKVAKDIQEKREWLPTVMDGKLCRMLCPDLQQVIYKPADDFKLLVETRISSHEKAETDKAEALRLQIQQEEEAKALEKVKAEQAEHEKNERIAISKRLLTETELAKSMLNPVDVSFNVDQVRTESARLFGLIKEGMNVVESDSYNSYSIKLSSLADKMNAGAEIVGALLTAAQSEAGPVDPDDAIRAEIKDLRERASHIYQSAQRSDSSMSRRAEESQADELNRQANKLQKELDINTRIKTNIALAASWLDESVDILTLDAGAVMAESERLLDLITENTSFAEVNSYSAHSKELMNLADEIINTKGISQHQKDADALREIAKLDDDEFDSLIGAAGCFDGEFVETDDFDGNGDSQAMTQAYIPPSQSGWDAPQVAASDPIIADEDAKEERKLGVICPKRLKVISFVRTEFGLNMGAAEEWLIKEFGGNIQKPSTGDLF